MNHPMWMSRSRCRFHRTIPQPRDSLRPHCHRNRHRSRCSPLASGTEPPTRPSRHSRRRRRHRNHVVASSAAPSSVAESQSLSTPSQNWARMDRGVRVITVHVIIPMALRYRAGGHRAGCITVAIIVSIRVEGGPIDRSVINGAVTVVVGVITDLYASRKEVGSSSSRSAPLAAYPMGSVQASMVSIASPKPSPSASR